MLVKAGEHSGPVPAHDRSRRSRRVDGGRRQPDTQNWHNPAQFVPTETEHTGSPSGLLEGYWPRMRREGFARSMGTLNALAVDGTLHLMDGSLVARATTQK